VVGGGQWAVGWRGRLAGQFKWRLHVAALASRVLALTLPTPKVLCRYTARNI